MCPPASDTGLGDRPEACGGMEQRGGAESPELQDERGESPLPSKLNGSPSNPRARQGNTPLRPLGGGPIRHTRKLEQTHAHLTE